MEILANLLTATGGFYLFAVMVPLIRIDLTEHRLPNRLVLPAFPIALTSQVFGSWILGEWYRLGLSASAALVALAVGIAANRFASLGMGDVKLISAASLVLGWYNLLSPVVFVFLGFLVACAVVFSLLLLGKTTLSKSIALGPYLLAGFAVTQILTWSTYFGGFSPNFLI
jgi:leader peptidase (prepilin peptidase)/N-methyltransferase